MTEVTITVTVSPELARRILDLLEADEQDPDETGPTNQQLQQFMNSLTSGSLQIVATIAHSSIEGRPTSRTSLRKLIAPDDDIVVGDTKLNGPIGTIGKRWKQFIGDGNPLVGHRNTPDEDWMYQIHVDLAKRLLQK